ncbi:MAG: hypothetical protein M1820_003712 [Bogoriella megaspora]|nr:MAG: hypothetical protein M1820_003712 [Bogoriella megaspora]
MTSTGIVTTLFLKFTKPSPRESSTLRSEYSAITKDIFRNINQLTTNLLRPEVQLSYTSRILNNGPDNVASMIHVFDAAEYGLDARLSSLEGEAETIAKVRGDANIKRWLIDHDLQATFLPLSTYTTLSTTNRGFACFDMDSTLIEQEVIDLLAANLGPEVERKVSGITARAMAGELDFSASLTERVALLKGVPSTIWKDLESQIRISPGARELISTLRGRGWKTAVLSGGFTPLALWLKEQLGLDYAYANILLNSTDGMELTGEVDPETVIVNAEEKQRLMEATARKEKIPMENVIAVGDGANDLLMLNAAALGVAFNAKEKVKREAPAALDSNSLADILFILGIERGDRKP